MSDMLVESSMIILFTQFTVLVLYIHTYIPYTNHTSFTQCSLFEEDHLP